MIYSILRSYAETYAAFTLNGFDDQERNLTFVKTVFQVLKFKFFMLVILSKLSILFISYISRDLDNINRLVQDFRSVPGCQNCMCKRGIILIDISLNRHYLKTLRLPV